MFLDEAHIHVTAGKGGDGIVHFRREKYVPRGGPDGGDGGRGGHVVLRVRPTMHGLTSFREKQRFRAKPGGKGGPSKRSGRQGEDLVLAVPPGTLVRSEPDGELLADLVEPGDEVLVARGGRGGRGNSRFATSRRQAPRLAERGEPGEERRLHLELRLIADVGIVGVPNAGKSTLLAALTEARPKIADYPFTTLQPNLGVAVLPSGDTLVLADIPGLIEGAHRGVGLGDAFLRHIRRTRVLIHLLDGLSADPLADLGATNAELAAYDPALAAIPQVLAVNKMDDPAVEQRWPALRESLRSLGLQAVPISAQRRTNLETLLERAAKAVAEAPLDAAPSTIPVHRPGPDPSAFELRRDPDGAWRVSGTLVERSAAMTYWEHDEGVRRFQRRLAGMGVEAALREAGVQPGETVRIGEFELEWQE
ncbi:MAG TPA: GTPase ObgE [Anaerolineales bacterium]|nr:GTPase ObgE [Anaerolineales bacterium]